MQERRFGRFEIDLDLMDRKPEVCRLILRDVIVLSARPALEGERILYTGLHPSFDFVPVGCDIPLYRAEVIEPREGRISVQWSRRSPPASGRLFDLPDTPGDSPKPNFDEELGPSQLTLMGEEVILRKGKAKS